MAQEYWHDNYWHANYWHANYWADVDADFLGQIAATTTLEGPGESTADYWGSNYWGYRYWSLSYWGAGTPGLTTFTGTFESSIAAIGDIDATLDATTSDFQGATQSILLFDIPINISVTWMPQAYSAHLGTIARTLDDDAAAFTGQFSEDFIGAIATTLEANAPNFDGTHVAPANATGTIDPVLAEFLPNFDGLFFGVTPGDITTTLDDQTSAFTGSFTGFVATGTIADTLAAFTTLWTGAFIDAAANVGPIAATTSTTASFTGAVSSPNLVPVKRRNRGNSPKRRNKHITEVA